MRKLLALPAATALAFAGTAAAAGGGTISVALHPDRISKRPHVTVSASGFTDTSLPTSIEIKVQRGFKASAKSVAKLCANPSACPAASQIGSGTAQVTASTILGPLTDTVNFTLYLGRREVAGDIASVIVTGKDARYGITASGTGRLFKDSAGGLELLVNKFPTTQNPAVSAVTLNSLSLTAGATRTIKRHHRKVTYSLITNPSQCSGHWKGIATITFPDAKTS